ncbi:hypothetical protein JOF29_005317 [Kribbella aluminosa]|uniref:Uncharacterized protein n=1 Tax=Kribbella aluminosa TaxID=416017 RepID=A0ABS4URF6_9ACTN|nr:hypothetical protein [Kribbella aluminosa]MBP2354207.1 hypothetical protein [Kribbella aluminosa]
MPDRLKMDYNLLNDAKTNLEELASNIKPTLDDSLFSTLAYDDGSVLGSSVIASAITSLHDNAEGTMTKAEKGLKELANSFGSVGEAFLQFDSEISQGMNATNSNLALSNYYRDKSQWDYYQAHKDQCTGPVADQPDFCSATNPGDHPPLDQTITTDRGNVHTHLDVDDKGNVTREETTVTYDGKTYHSVTTYGDDRHHIITDSDYPDGSTVHNDTQLKTDGSGTMKTTNSDGTWSEFTRGPNKADGSPAEWVETPDSVAANTPAQDDSYVAPSA